MIRLAVARHLISVTLAYDCCSLQEALQNSRNADNIVNVRPMGLTSELTVHDLLISEETSSIGERLRMSDHGIENRLVTIQNDHQSEDNNKWNDNV